ncbi:MAG: hypothetical protein R3D29_08735 [Nitratireductor sp.]
MFTAYVNSGDLKIAPNPQEVAATRWVTREELLREVAQAPEQFTPWFRIYLERYPDLSF